MTWKNILWKIKRKIIHWKIVLEIIKSDPLAILRINKFCEKLLLINIITDFLFTIISTSIGYATEVNPIIYILTPY
jgi:hypothetical protein